MALDVMLTDYGLTLFCAWFFWKLRGVDTQSISELQKQSRKLWLIFFSSITLATFAGGTKAGLFSDPMSLGYRIIWPISMLSVGITAASAWVIVGVFLNQSLKKWSIFAAILFLIYAFVVLFISQSFNVLVINYTPAVLVLLITCVYLYILKRKTSDLWLASGFLITFVAAYFQQAQISIHSVYFNHIATYHLVQAFGLWVIFKGAITKIKLELT